MFLTPKRILNLHVGGQVIRTTADHPFFVPGQGWTETDQLQVGDLLLAHNGQPSAIEGITDTGEEAVVYQMGFGTPPFPFSGLWGAGTLLETADGLKPIEDIKPGDLIVTKPDFEQAQEEADGQGYQCENGIPLRPVHDVFVRVEPAWSEFTMDEPLWELKAGGQVIQARPDHPFYIISKGWIPLWQLLPGDPLSTDDGQFLSVEEIIPPPGWSDRN